MLNPYKILQKIVCISRSKLVIRIQLNFREILKFFVVSRQEQKQPINQKLSTLTSSKKEVKIEYVSAPLEALLGDISATHSNNDRLVDHDKPTNDNDANETQQPPLTARDEFKKILERFGTVEELLGKEQPSNDKDIPSAPYDQLRPDRPTSTLGDGDAATHLPADDTANGNEELDKLSKKKRKEITRPKIAELKQRCDRPEVVEVWDVAAVDPELLVFLKSYRNTVPVPRHWSQKRNYLQGKRGIEKPPFKLPAFIEATGIGEMRQAYLEKAEDQKLKSKGRDRMTPKMGKLDIDYQILHDAFFRHQTKPPLSFFGELYYEGKEYEAQVRHARPGTLSKELQDALDMHPNTPPPWLLGMQRYGPPPSYPSLKIPGLNAPIPHGASFGYHQGGWGKPPVDEYGRPLYGDVFGQGAWGDGDTDAGMDRGAFESHWGDLNEESEEEEEEEESEEEEEEGEEEERDRAAETEEARIAEEELAAGYTSVASGIASTFPGGLETPTEVQLRKAAEASAAEGPKALYQVLEQQKASVGGNIMGSEHTYVVPGSGTGQAGEGGKEKKLSVSAAKRLEALRKEMPSDVDVAIDPGDLEALDDASLKDLYESRVAEKRAAAGREDFSDLVAAKAASQKRKATEKASGKEKKFKF